MNLANIFDTEQILSRRGFLRAVSGGFAYAGACLAARVGYSTEANSEPEQRTQEIDYSKEITYDMIKERLKKRGKYIAGKESELDKYLEERCNTNKARTVVYQLISEDPAEFLKKFFTSEELKEYKSYRIKRAHRKLLENHPWKIDFRKPDESDRAFAYLVTVALPKRNEKMLDDSYGSAGFAMPELIIGPRKR